METQTKQKGVADIVNETLEHIRENGRALNEDGDTCVYLSSGGNKCAVGWCIDPEKYDEEFEDMGARALDDYVSGGLDSILMPEYRGHSLSFWAELQNLHDRGSLWTYENYLTHEGEEYIDSLCNRHNINRSDIIIPK